MYRDSSAEFWGEVQASLRVTQDFVGTIESEQHWHDAPSERFYSLVVLVHIDSSKT
jgi:hypothetical protein